jgi:3-oxoacyl-[acyl-carrier protein] reductase
MNSHMPGAVVVSGGSRGLGLAIVRLVLERGRVVASFARRETAEMTELCAAHSKQLFFRTLDTRDPDRIDSFLDETLERFGSIHALVNNAAIGQDQLLAHLAPGEIESLVATNVTAPILLTRGVLRRMLLNPGGGRIVNISSICGSRGYAGLTVYSATKGAMDALTRSLAREVGSRNILVNSVAPGFFLSEMSSVLSPEQVDVIRRRTPTERSVRIEDVLPLVDLLLFGEINMTGQTLFVDGGISA